MSQDGSASFRTMTASGAIPGGNPSFQALTAAGDTLPERIPASAELYTAFKPMTAGGTASAASVAEGDGEFKALTAFAYAPQSTDISFEPMVAQAQGYVGTIARGAPSFVVAEAAGTLVGGSIASAAPRFQPASARASSSTPGVSSGAASFARAYARASGIGGGVASGAPVFAPVMVSGVGVEPSVGVASISFLPMAAAGRAEEALANTWAAYHMNMGSEALTEYQNYRFNSMAQFNGRFLAAGDEGIVELAGADDRGSPIAWSARTGFMDGSARGGLNGGDSAQLKHLDELLLAARFTGPVRIRVWTDESTYFDYNLPTYRPGVLQQVRAKLGKGLKSRFFRVELSGLNNAAAEISSMQLPMIPLRRRAG